MSLKSLFKKVVPSKKAEPDPPPAAPEMEIQYEMPFEKLDTRIEKIGAVAEIDIFVNDEKYSIHTLAGETKVGRDPAQCDIAIPELVVSKLHCSFYAVGEDYFIKDHDSTNGIYVNNEKVTQDRLIQHNDAILLGKKGTVKIIFHKRR